MFKRKLQKIHANIAAARGKTKAERGKIRDEVLSRYREDYKINSCHCTPNEIQAAMQDLMFPKEIETAEKLMIVLVPEHDAMSGGIFSFFSIIGQMRRLKRVHGYEVALITRPTIRRETYFRNSNFRNSEHVFRFDQLLRCQAVRDLYIHVPEYAAADFDFGLDGPELAYLKSRDTLHINILNQNIKLMPERDAFAKLRELTPNVTQSVAHHAYFNQDMADRYDLPTLLLPAYTDLSSYPASSLGDKEKLIIYSPDEAPHKQRCLERIAAELPDFKLQEIRGITFDHFMDLATRCMFSITFGEGFDGYLAQPIHQGGIGFSVYNEDFFPGEHFKKYANIFGSDDEMVAEISGRMRSLQANPAAYAELNRQFVLEYEKLYSLDDYVEQIRKLCLKQFELYPRERVLN